MFESIKTRLIAFCVGAVVIALGVVTVADYLIVRKHTQAQVQASLDALASAHGATVAQWVRTQRDIVVALQPVAKQADPIPMLVQAAKSGRMDNAYIGMADKKVHFSTPQNDLPPDYDPTARPWYKQAAAANGPVLTEPYVDAGTKRLVVTFAQAVKEGGQTLAVVASDVYLDGVVETVKSIKPTPSGWAFLVSRQGKIIAHPNANLAMKPSTEMSAQFDAAALESSLKSGASWVEAKVGEQTLLLRAAAIADTDWVLVTAADKGEALASLSSLVNTSLIALVLVAAVAGVLVAGLVTAMLRGLDNVRAALDEISAGGGDLTQRLPASGGDEIGRIAQSFNTFAEKIQHIMLDVRSTTGSITTASSEIALGAQDLSQRTEQTASNLQQAASSMEQLTGTVRQTADATQTANQLASSASTAAAKGGQVVGQVVATMEEINTSSKKINDIIGVIDGIAFQTNILALNAAVEAARAGEQGRGFAVVAGEVRTLAQRSAEAAKEIKSLIGASVDKVEIGSRLVQEAGTSMDEIVASVQRVSDIIGEISAASSEQRDGIAQVNGAVTQLDQMTQQNAALVEESAAAAESLKDQAHKLNEVVSVFRLGNDSPVAPMATKSKTSSAARASAPMTAPRPAPAPKAAAPRPATAPRPASAPPASAPKAAADGDWETF
ncbi:methyl-accepting chemotaxis protein [Kinneretia asaccharophila]|uniref:Methyl-accepting chemotaxis sensory transducer with Cache sensor n=1 Tax=Roseateles asaccharophilus TaxID=582607 RepID=A0A4R6MTU9_9BURK|nr:methyl-accepting chemotaxis protein [Roseateles asaccharophilus]MDN3546491.1 methyl-accepting chemotaxis protein [Roseateles asaccharophilus]TDP05531.1 methyl-accepting chemotaxis sensory transducer with Cache sensor [Roseateles asaccharophilus]